MLFSSITFLYYFLPLIIIFYFLVPFRFKNFVLLLFSLIFYSWGEPKYIILMILSIFCGYIEGLLIQKSVEKKYSRWVLACSCCIHLGLLGYFKYFDFLIENINALGGHLSPLRIALPIGISFYTFQIISYLIDVYRRDCNAQHNLISFGAYVSMFPQLIAGPIVRYKDIESQLLFRTHSISKASLGIRRFVIGLSKKVLLANSFGKLCSIFLETQDPSVLYYWLYAVSFALQIYFDFSGYSDMAIGLGKLFGFEFPENFNYPYMSKSVTEFWRRWHMTLGNWFRDYVYIPMGGNRVPKKRWFFNIAVVWFLTGLWHGAAWNFILWGLLFAVILVLEKQWIGKLLEKHSIISHFYVIGVLIISFVIFNATNLQNLRDILLVLFTGNGLPFVSHEFLYCFKSYGVLLFVGILGATPFCKEICSNLESKEKGNHAFTILEPLVLLILACIVTAYLINDSYNPFLYFRF